MTNHLYGYAGRLLQVDLSRGQTQEIPLTEGLSRAFLGGKALGAYMLHRLLPAGVDPLSPDNIAIFLTGPLTGGMYPGAARAGLVARSPLTGTFLDSYAGGSFGPRLKWAGYDGLVVAGRADRPVYLVLGRDGLHIKDAAGLWGLGTFDADRRLREWEGGDQRVSTAVIGPAGENLCLTANVISGRRAFGRGGAGAVLGSKNVKAVVVRGRGGPPLFDPSRFAALTREARAKIAASPMTGPGGAFPRIGTMRTVEVTEETGTLPTYNWRENHSGFAEKIDAAAFERFIVQPKACYACPIACGRVSRAVWQGRTHETIGPEYETIFAFGPNLGIDDPEVVIAANRLCEDLGLDTISAGGAVGLAMECFERGLIRANDADGLDLSFGRGDSALALVEKMGRRQGLGGLLADGVKRFVRHFPQAADWAVEIKGLELPGYDPRGMKGQALTYALSDRGGCHLRSSTLGPELMGRPPGYDRLSYEGKADLVRRLQVDKAVFNSLIQCLFAGYALSLDDLAEAVFAATGFDFGVEGLRLAGRRAWHLTRLFNVKNGFGPADDALPRRLFAEAASTGPSRGQVVDRAEFERMKAEYYRSAGWDPHTGAPTPETLHRLGLDGLGVEG
jgi:aldehyde:ferredoxin oxidoreductase